MHNTFFASKGKHVFPTIKQTIKGKESSGFVQYFSILSFGISKKTSGKETSAIAWLGSSLIDFYCARLVYFARVLLGEVVWSGGRHAE